MMTKENEEKDISKERMLITCLMIVLANVAFGQKSHRQSCKRTFFIQQKVKALKAHKSFKSFHSETIKIEKLIMEIFI